MPAYAVWYEMSVKSVSNRPFITALLSNWLLTTPNRNIAFPAKICWIHDSKWHFYIKLLVLCYRNSAEMNERREFKNFTWENVAHLLEVSSHLYHALIPMKFVKCHKWSRLDQTRLDLARRFDSFGSQNDHPMDGTQICCRRMRVLLKRSIAEKKKHLSTSYYFS